MGFRRFGYDALCLLEGLDDHASGALDRRPQLDDVLEDLRPGDIRQTNSTR